MQRPTLSGTTNLIDILDRVLDKGLVIAGDIRVSLANVELLTIRIRLLVCSVDKAEQIGLNWWKHDPNLTTQAPARQSRLGAAPRSLPLVSRSGRVQAATTAAKTTRRNRSASTGSKRKKK